MTTDLDSHTLFSFSTLSEPASEDSTEDYSEASSHPSHPGGLVCGLSPSQLPSSRALFLDFEQELEDILGRREGATRSSSIGSDLLEVRRSSGVSAAVAVEYEPDGTLDCGKLNYDVLVRF